MGRIELILIRAICTYEYEDGLPCGSDEVNVSADCILDDCPYLLLKESEEEI